MPLHQQSILHAYKRDVAKTTNWVKRLTQNFTDYIFRIFDESGLNFKIIKKWLEFIYIFESWIE